VDWIMVWNVELKVRHRRNILGIGVIAGLDNVEGKPVGAQSMYAFTRPG